MDHSSKDENGYPFKNLEEYLIAMGKIGGPYEKLGVSPIAMGKNGDPYESLGKSVMPTKKNGSPYENLGKSIESCTRAMARNEKAHDGPYVIEKLQFPNCGTNLREWLQSKDLFANKAFGLRLFRKIVRIVNDAHGQGIGLLELRPSSFILLENGDVTYVGQVLHIEELLSVTHDNTNKRDLDKGISGRDGDDLCVKMQKLDNDNKVVRPEKGRMTSNTDRMENLSYGLSEGFENRELPFFNIFCLGLMLFELLCHFESMEAHTAAMVDLHHRILPPKFLCGNPKEAAMCFWMLHPNPSSRPTTRKILQSEFLYDPESPTPSNDEDSCTDMIEYDLLLYFLSSLQQHQQNKASTLLENIQLLDLDIDLIEKKYVSTKSFDTKKTDVLDCSTSSTDVVRSKLLDNIDQLESAYFSLRSHGQHSEIPRMDRMDTDILKESEHSPSSDTPKKLKSEKEISADRVGIFFDGICRFARHSKFEVCGALKNGEITNSNNVICSLSFDRDEEYLATGGVCKKIKIFEFGSFLDDNFDAQYPLLELSNKYAISCVCWNACIKNHLASTDYDGKVQTWDASTGQVFAKYNEHRKRAWSVDFSRVDPTKFASGGDDCSIRIWSTNEKKSVGAIWNPANICCVQFSACSSHLLAYGSANHKIYCYDLRHTKIPWCTLAGHSNVVSYVKFLDSETIVSASTDNTLKLWDLKNTNLEGLSTNACGLTFSGHKNDKNFVGLAALDGYIACGSETNEVYTYYRSLAMPIISHKFENSTGKESTSDGSRHFVSSVCWRTKSKMIVAANSTGSINILRMV